MSAVLPPTSSAAPVLAPAQLEARFEPMTPGRLAAVLSVEQSAYSHPWSRGNFIDTLAAGHLALCLVAAPHSEAAPDDPATAAITSPMPLPPELLEAAPLLPAAGGDEVLLGYFVAMPGFEEVHLLNITVAPPFQRQGWAAVMLDALVLWSRARRAEWLWLEVRLSNVRAQQVYLRRGFARVGVRKGYYPAGHGEREDAVVMSLRVEGA